MTKGAANSTFVIRHSSFSRNSHLTNRQTVVSFAPFPQVGSARPAVMSSQLLEEAMKKIPNQQQLVNVVSKRVKQLSAGHRPMVDFGVRMGFADIALTEIIDGKLTFDAPTTLPLDRY